MAVDTRLKRSVAVGVGVYPSTLQLPRPDGTIAFGDRLAVAGVYPIFTTEDAVDPYIFTVAGAFQIRPSSDSSLTDGTTTIHSFSVPNVGTTMTVDVYDSASTENNKVIEYVSADGKVNWRYGHGPRSGLKLFHGFRVVVGGTPGRVVIDWD